MRKLLSLLLVVPLLLSCTTTYQNPRFASSKDEKPEFLGVVDLLDKDKPLDVLFVHGMCTHDKKWADEAVGSLYSALGGRVGDVQLEPENVPGSPIVVYKQDDLRLDGGTIRARAILWSPVTTPMKQSLCYDQTVKSKACHAGDSDQAYPYKRALLNARLKDELLNDCLADAMIYQGVSRDKIRAQMKAALRVAMGSLGRDQDAARPLVVITESLGSKVAFDAITELVEDDKTPEALRRSVGRPAQVFMEANQLPILSLAERQIEDAKSAAEGAATGLDPLAKALKAYRTYLQRHPSDADRMSKAGQLAPPQVVAFTDPNDVLSYALVPWHASQGQEYSVIDVIVSNDHTYFFYVENPMTAHKGYRRANNVKSLMACGHPRSNKCGEQP